MSKLITKRALAASMKKLMLKKPFDKLTIHDVCADADISRRSFYRYFRDKYDLLSWIYHDDYFSKIQIRDDWVIWDYMPQICEYCYEDRQFFKKAVQVEGQNSARSYWREFLRPIIERDFRDTYLTEKSADFYVIRTCDALFDYMHEWISSPEIMPPEEFAFFVRHSVALHAKRSWEIAAGIYKPKKED